MKALLTILKLKLLHPKATVYVRLYPSQQKGKKVYWQLSSNSIGYYPQCDEIIVDVF